MTCVSWVVVAGLTIGVGVLLGVVWDRHKAVRRANEAALDARRELLSQARRADHLARELEESESKRASLRKALNQERGATL